MRLNISNHYLMKICSTFYFLTKYIYMYYHYYVSEICIFNRYSFSISILFILDINVILLICCFVCLLIVFSITQYLFVVIFWFIILCCKEFILLSFLSWNLFLPLFVIHKIKFFYNYYYFKYKVLLYIIILYSALLLCDNKYIYIL